MRVTCVVGLGRVGLPTAALIARAGARVRGCDADPEVLARIRDGVAGDDEPGLGARAAADPGSRWWSRGRRRRGRRGATPPSGWRR